MSCLDVVRKVMANPAGVTKVRDFDGNRIHSGSYVFLALCFWRVILIKGNTGNSLGKILPEATISPISQSIALVFDLRCLLLML